MESFLIQILGQQGFKALEPLIKNEDLVSFIIPRVVVSFLNHSPYGAIGLGYFDVLRKSEAGYSGEMDMSDFRHAFSNLPAESVAAIVSVSLGTTLSPKIKDLDLAKLSKTIDLLIKSRIDSKPNVNFPDSKTVPDRPREPTLPVQPLGAAPSTVKRGPINKSFVISEKDQKKKCEICGKPQFKEGKFVGCTCVKPLAKSIDTQMKDGKCRLIIDTTTLDEDEILTIFSLFTQS